MDNQNNSISFWNYLKSHKIEIPIIQRDYAQGRTGKELLRSKFLASLKGALDRFADSKEPSKETPLKLDFVYGSEDSSDTDKTVKPLDGQQRLTTLWLMHWYIALRAGIFKSSDSNADEIAKTFRRFSYETRISSRDFCRHLSNPVNFSSYASGPIREFITNRTWFLSKWTNDPTIKSMLTMLAGSEPQTENKKKRKQTADLIDGLEKIFKDKTPDDFKKYWELLTSDNPPIIFYRQSLTNFGLTDDLYIKMNARGKQLSAFENFKADLIGFIRSRAENIKDTKEKAKWERLLDVRDGIPIKLDTVWTEMFWANRSAKMHIDELYMAFINRFFWVEQARLQNGGDYLYDAANNLYTGFDYYKFITSTKADDNSAEPTIPYEVLDRLTKVLDRSNGINALIPKCAWLNDSFDFIPRYENGSENINDLTIISRVLFAAVCQYLSEGDYDKDSLRRWMRVVYNLVSGEDHNGRPHVRSVEAVKSLIRRLDELDSHHIYECLKELNDTDNEDDDSSKAVGRRLKEEREKASKILDDNGHPTLYTGSHKITDKQEPTWEDMIVNAENYGFFKGSIGFLFTNDKGEVCWDDFDIKYTNAKKYFSAEITTSQAIKSPLGAAELLKSLISNFTSDNFTHVLWYNYRVFNNKPSTWLYYLLNNNIQAPVHKLMMGDTAIRKLPEHSPDENERYLYLLSNTGLLNYVMSYWDKCWIRDNYNDHTAIYPSSTGIFLDADFRDSFFALPDIEVDKNAIVPDTSLYYGSDISFSFEGQKYLWHHNYIIYLLDENGNNCVKDREGETDLLKYYCIKVDTDDVNLIKQALQNVYEDFRSANAD